jgi:hypothetical protein
LAAHLSEPSLPELSNKLDYFARHARDYDSVFIGSSRIYHGISPALFDTDLCAAGHKSHSFNLAADDLKPPESLKVLAQVMRIHPVRTVFLEWTKIQIDPHTADQTTQRDVAWHSSEWTWSVLREVPHGHERGLYSYHQGELFRIHLGLWLRHYANLGRAQDWFRPTTQRVHFREELGPSTDGYRPRGTTVWNGVDRFRERVRKLTVGATQIAWLDDPLFSELIENAAGSCRLRGTQLILVVPPTLNDLPKPPSGIPLLAFNDPHRYPTLFSVKRRADWEHLNEAGALEFSNALAAAYVAMRSP